MKQQITSMASSFSPSIKFSFLSPYVLNILYSPLNTYKILVAQSLLQPICVFVARIVKLRPTWIATYSKDEICFLCRTRGVAIFLRSLD